MKSHSESIELKPPVPHELGFQLVEFQRRKEQEKLDSKERNRSITMTSDRMNRRTDDLHGSSDVGNNKRPIDPEVRTIA